MARLLENKAQRSALQLRHRLSDILSQIRAAAAGIKDKAVREQLQHFVKVTQSYRPGLFHGYAVADLPRTNNDFEHSFSSHRYHERRASGRKRASPALVVMGSMRVVSGLPTRVRPDEGLELPAGCVEQWRQRHAALRQRRAARRQQARFRRSPAVYL